MTVHISQIVNRQAKVNAALSFLIYFCSHEDTENTNTYTQFSQATQEYEPYMEQHISFYTRSRKRGTHNWPRSPSGRAVKRRCTHAGAEQWKTSEVRRKASDANKESILSNKQSMKSLSVSFFAKQNNGLIITTIYQTSRVTSSSPLKHHGFVFASAQLQAPPPTHFLLIFRQVDQMTVNPAPSLF